MPRNPEGIQALRRHGAIDIPTKTGWTALAFAAGNLDRGSVQALLDVENSDQGSSALSGVLGLGGGDTHAAPRAPSSTAAVSPPPPMPPAVLHRLLQRYSQQRQQCMREVRANTQENRAREDSGVHPLDSSRLKNLNGLKD